MSSYTRYDTGTLTDWLLVPDFEVTNDSLVTQGQEAAQVTSDEVHKKRYGQYLALRAQLHSHPNEGATIELMEVVNEMPHEYIFCLWERTTLVGTIQASLLFPACRPTVHISNVVVDVAFRGKSHGEFLMKMIRGWSRQCWGQRNGTLRYELTSREERGTRGFYEGLGYSGTPTVRYVK